MVFPLQTQYVTVAQDVLLTSGHVGVVIVWTLGRDAI